MYLQIYFEPKLDLDRLRGMLDTCGPWSRRHGAVHALTKPQLATLYEASEGAEALTLDDFVPTTEPLVEVIHSGKNSLPLFNHFQKRFCRADGADAPDELWGYNHQTMMPFTGPGYFVAAAEKGELVVDYTRTPPRKPAAWPAILDNNARLGRFVWGGMVDRLRKVSAQVTVGRAYRHGKATDDYFALCREEPAA